MTDIFGVSGYQSQSTRALASIQSSHYPDTNKDFEANLQRLNSFVDYIGQYIQTMQKGVDQANEDPITKIRDTFNGIGILLGGGALGEITDINLGNLQYYFPAIGALLGFDATTPFPINLFEAAEHFLLGYIVPLDAFSSAIEDIFLGLLSAIGLDSDSIANIKVLLDAFVGLAGDIQDFVTNLSSLLDIFGISDTSGLSPFADLWHVLTQLLGGLSLSSLGNLVNPVFHTLAPWITELAQFVSFLDSIIKAFSGGSTNIGSILDIGSSLFGVVNLLNGAPASAGLTLPFTLPGTLGSSESTGLPIMEFFTNFLQFFNIGSWLNGSFNPITAAITFATSVLKPTGILAWLDGGILPNALSPQLLYDLITSVESAFTSIPFIGPIIAKPLFDAINALLGIGRTNTTQITQIQNTINSNGISGGVSISDSFDYATAATLPTASYNITRIGTGIGSWGPDGLGASIYQSGGGSAQLEIRQRHKTPMATSTQSISCVLNSAFGACSGNNLIYTSAYSKVLVKLQGRMNAAETSWCECRIQWDYFGTPFISLAYQKAGAFQLLGTFTSADWTNDPNTQWEYRIGNTAGGSRNHRVFRNNVKIIDITESGTTGSTLDDVNNLFAAHAVMTGQDNFGTMINPPDMGIFAFSDRLATT